jgi:hypothetical protein
VSGIVIKPRENWKLAGRRETFVKIATHNSKAPTVSLTGVKVSSNPTKITGRKKNASLTFNFFATQTD